MAISSTLALELGTANGPNWISDIDSGPAYAELGGGPDLNVLPNLLGTLPGNVTNSSYWESWDDIYESLYRPDARSFMVIYRVGTVRYNAEVDDPFFLVY
jgi:hypothetical protein